MNILKHFIQDNAVKVTANIIEMLPKSMHLSLRQMLIWGMKTIAEKYPDVIEVHMETINEYKDDPNNEAAVSHLRDVLEGRT